MQVRYRWQGLLTLSALGVIWGTPDCVLNRPAKTMTGASALDCWAPFASSRTHTAGRSMPLKPRLPSSWISLATLQEGAAHTKHRAMHWLGACFRM